MELILLFGGVVFMVAIIAFIWGRIDPKVKAQNTKYEKSLKDNARDKSQSPTKKEVTEQYKIKDNMPASLDTLDDGQKMFKTDMTGLIAYFEEMPNMERIYNELTYAIRNGSSVKQYLIDANIMNDQETMRIIATGFSDISSFLRGMLEIEENDELKKDYNACLEVITTLDKSEKKFKDELNSFDSKGMSQRYSIEEKNLDINYWYDFVLTRVNSHLKLENSENDLDNVLLENIWSHADEYGRTHENRSFDDKRIISLIRILCYGHIYDCLSNTNKNDKLSSLKILHAKASLYGAIKFALFSGVSKEEVKEWFPSVEFDKKLISGYNPFEQQLQSFCNGGEDPSNNDISEKIKIILDSNERVPIYELSDEKKSNSPSWFKGPFYTEGGLVESLETGNKIELDHLEKSIFTEVQLNKLFIEFLYKANLKREDFENPFLSNLVLTVDSGTLWLESNNKEAYNKLFNT